MAAECKASSRDGQSATLTITDEYMVINGGHYDIVNGYLRRTLQPRAIAIRDILHMEYTTLRSKRLFMAFIILMSLPALIFTHIISNNWFREKLPDILDFLDDIDPDVLWQILVFFIFVCFIILLWYYLVPYRILRISTVGGVMAVRIKDYRPEELDQILNMWDTVMLKPYM